MWWLGYSVLCVALFPLPYARTVLYVKVRLENRALDCWHCCMWCTILPAISPIYICITIICTMIRWWCSFVSSTQSWIVYTYEDREKDRYSELYIQPPTRATCKCRMCATWLVVHVRDMTFLTFWKSDFVALRPKHFSRSAFPHQINLTVWKPALGQRATKCACGTS